MNILRPYFLTSSLYSINLPSGVISRRNDFFANVTLRSDFLAFISGSTGGLVEDCTGALAGLFVFVGFIFAFVGFIFVFADLLTSIKLVGLLSVNLYLSPSIVTKSNNKTNKILNILRHLISFIIVQHRFVK
jgi:hypothetical protein